MEDQPKPQELAIVGDISRLGHALWGRTLTLRGLNNDPKMISAMLYKRLWSNHRGFLVLYNGGLTLESDIVLRSGIEAAICIAANYHLRDRFTALLRADAVFTLASQIKVHRAAGDQDLVKDAEATLRVLQAGLPSGSRARKLDWAQLASEGQVQELYGFHRMLSGVSSHVTGVSVLRGVADADEEGDDRLDSISRRTHLMILATATLQGAMLHAGIIDDEQLVLEATGLLEKFAVVSLAWRDE